MKAPTFELLQWNAPGTSAPDAGITMACWTDTDGFFSGWWDGEAGGWIDAATGAPVGDQAVTWANPKGPHAQREMQPAEVPVDQVRAALGEALELLRGWIDWKCGKRHKAEHLAVVETLAKAGGLS